MYSLGELDRCSVHRGQPVGVMEKKLKYRLVQWGRVGVLSLDIYILKGEVATTVDG